MASRKDKAIAELKTRLVRKFGKEREEVVDREIHTLVSEKETITVQDLNDLERAIRRQRKQAQTPGPTTGRPTNFPDLPDPVLSTSIPSISSLVPITTGKRIYPQSPSPPLFPRYDPLPVLDSSLPEPHRNTSLIDYGIPENQRFSGYLNRSYRKIPDSWSKIIKYDTAKYKHEEAARRTQKRRFRSSYRQALDEQIEQKRKINLANSCENEKLKSEIAAEFASFEAEKDKKAKIKSQNREKERIALNLFQSILQEQKMTKKLEIRREKCLLDELIFHDKEEKERQKTHKKAVLLKIQSTHLQEIDKKLKEKSAKKSQNRINEREKLIREKTEFDEEEKRQKEAIFRRNKAVSEVNLRNASEKRREKERKNGELMGELKIFLEAEKKEETRKKMQIEVREILEKQRLEQREKIEKKATSRALISENLSKDTKKQQEIFRNQLQAQIEEKEIRLEHEKGFSCMEQALNRDLIAAALDLYP